MKKISIILPCYNEEKSLPLFYESVISVLSQCDSEYELLFVDDGARDKTKGI